MKNIDLVTTYFEYFNAHDWVKMSQLYSENAQFKDPSLGEGIIIQTKEEIRKKYTELQQMFPDIEDQVIQLYPSGENIVIVEFVSSGTAQDGTRFKLPICSIFTFENGLITKDYSYFDNF